MALSTILHVPPSASPSTRSAMPFYQMLCIAAHYAEYVSLYSERLACRHTNNTQAHIKGLVTLAAKHVMDNGGVVRKIESWGTLTLPQPMKKHNVGEYVLFNASVDTAHRLSTVIGL